MMLENFRKKIDGLDDEIVGLLVSRMELCAKIAKFKKENGIKIEDKTREKELMSRVAQKCPKEYSEYVENVYKTVISESKKYQSALNGEKNG